MEEFLSVGPTNQITSQSLIPLYLATHRPYNGPGYITLLSETVLPNREIPNPNIGSRMVPIIFPCYSATAREWNAEMQRRKAEKKEKNEEDHLAD